MKKIIYVDGDATQPIGDGKKILIHCCNTINLMGAGIALAIRQKWPIVYEKYKKLDCRLGEVQFIRVEEDLVVGNMIGQEGVGFKNGVPPVRYDAVDSCLKKVYEVAQKHGASVHLPYKMCSDRAGGKWEKIEELITKNLSEKDISVTIYDFKE